jgi:prefoldin subunit 5
MSATPRRAALAALMLAPLPAAPALAQDVPGIEICTAEKSMERRTSCLQSNVNFLKASQTKAALDAQARLDAATREIEALKRQVDALKAAQVALETRLEQLKPAAKPAESKPAEPAKK